jgi:nucleotide-binding universal stress UspA family protein
MPMASGTERYRVNPENGKAGEVMTAQSNEDRQKIVVGVDGSPSSKTALQWAAREAQLTASAVEVVTAWEYPELLAPPPADFNPEELARRVLDSAIEEVLGARPSVEVRRVVTERHPAPALVDASKGASLLVVGNRGHGEFVGVLIGSVSLHCVAHADCPVVILRGPE